MDIVSAVHTVSSALSDPAGKTALVSSSLKRMSDLVDDSYKSDHRNFIHQERIRKEKAVLLETDKSGLFAVLPKSFERNRTKPCRSCLCFLMVV
ncbi:unnamed protein product [Ixodes hexagonus]